MKRLLFLVASLAFCFSAAAQIDAQKAAAEAAKALEEAPKVEAPVAKPVYWDHSVMTQFNFGQSAFWNWAKGGNNNYAMTAYVDANANYTRDNISWKNRLQLDYGIMYSEDKPLIQKTKDRILLESTWGYKATKTLNYTASFTFLNQFSNGYVYKTPSVADATQQDWKDARVLKSGFFSPAYITLGLGMDWVPNNWLTVNFAPITSGLTVVADEELRKNYGMELKSKYEDAPEPLLPSYYRAARFEFGAQLKADAKVKINDNFDASTQLIIFSNYLHNPQNLRVNWDNRFMWKLNRFFTLTVTTNLIYDDTVLIVDEDHPDGRRLIQFSDALQFGFTYTFASKKK